MSGYLCFQIELTRGYDYSAFREDLKKLYTSAGVEGKNTVFLFTDTQVNYPLLNGSFMNTNTLHLSNEACSLMRVSSLARLASAISTLDNYSSNVKGDMSRYFESFSATCKITFSVKEATEYLFSKIDKHQNEKHKAKRNEDG